MAPRVFTEADFIDAAPSPAPVAVAQPRVFREEDFLPQQEQTRGIYDASRVAAGGFNRLLNALTLGGGDELVSGVNAGIDTLLGGNFGESYDRRKQEFNQLQKEFDDEAGLAKYTLEAGGLLMPVGQIGQALGITKNAGQAATVAQKVKDATKLGATLGAVGGGLSTDGGLKDRAQGAAFGGTVGAVMGGAGELAANKIAQIGRNTVKTGGDMRRKALGAQYGDYIKDAKSIQQMLPDGEDVATKTKDVLDDLVQSGKLGASRDPQELYKVVSQNSTELAKRVNQAIVAADSTIDGGVIPQFDNALDYLASGKVPGDQVDKYFNRLSKIAESVTKEGKGRLPYIQQQKIAIGTNYDPNDGVLNGFNRALYADLQNTVEKYVPAVKELNEELSKYQVVKPIIERSIARVEANDPARNLKTSFFTTGGYGAPTIIGTGVGSAVGGVPGAILGYGAGRVFGRAQDYIGSPGGQEKIGAALQKLGSKLGESRSLIERIPANAAREVVVGVQNKQERAKTLPPTNKGTSSYQRIQNNTAQSAGRTSQQRQITPPIRQEIDLLQRSLESSQELPANRQQVSLEKELRSPIQSLDNDTTDKGTTQYKNYVKQIVEQQPPLIRAIIDVESSGRHDAISKAGAIGLMQVMPANLRAYGIKDGTNPEQNIAAGGKVLAENIERYGDLRLALAAYNAGSRKVDAAIKRARSRNWASVAQYLPQETRVYPSKVLTKLNNYQSKARV